MAVRMVDLIEKKKQGLEFTPEEIDFAVQGYTQGDIPDYQMSALLMAICFQGMTRSETASLTLAFIQSGEILDLSKIHGIKVDKHSTGGVGDKISLITTPLVASLGIPVAKMSGKGLGHTGGTIDKLESIPGFRTDLSKDIFIDHVNRYKMAIASQSANLVPADKKIYALRDVTATVDSIPLIASSIMGKKIASGADAIVLDVKMGSGAFMKTLAQARELAETMVGIGSALHKKTIAVITDMNQPLGYAVGNILEIKEALDVLRGQGPEDVTTVALTIAAHMAVLGETYQEFQEAYEALAQMLHSGKALETFKTFVSIQGGDPLVVDSPELLPQAKYQVEVKANQDGYISAIDAEKIGLCAMNLGAGRKKKDDPIDPAAGVIMRRKVGEQVKCGDPLCLLHTNTVSYQEAYDLALEAYEYGDYTTLGTRQYVYDVITEWKNFYRCSL